MKEKIRILNDFVSIVEFMTDKSKVKKFIFVAEPATRSSEEGESWDGKIGAIKLNFENSPLSIQPHAKVNLTSNGPLMSKRKSYSHLERK